MAIKRAEELQPGDRVTGKKDQPFPVGTLTVSYLSDNNREGEKIGERIHWQEKNYNATIVRSDALFEVEE